MKYQAIFDIWAVPTDLLKHVQAGQMVYAGNKSNKGRFLGVRKTGSIVVAWQGNIQSHSDKLGYIKSLRNYAKGA
jgi:hypothetical protein